MKINHPIYTHVNYKRPSYRFTPSKNDYRPPINTWFNEKLSLIERIKILESRCNKMEYLLDKYGIIEL